MKSLLGPFSVLLIVWDWTQTKFARMMPLCAGCNVLNYDSWINDVYRVRAVEPAKVLGPSIAPKGNTEQALEHHNCQSVNSESEEWIENGRNLSISVMLSKPIIALEFNCLKMRVEAPIVVSNCSESPLKFSWSIMYFWLLFNRIIPPFFFPFFLRHNVLQ